MTPPERKASELLRALAEQLGYGEGSLRSMLQFGDSSSEEHALFDALPEIIAVVEAAEGAVHTETPFLAANGYRYPLKETLAALQAALGETSE